MSARLAWMLLAITSLLVTAQDSSYHFTSGVSNPAPVPGQPFTITWTGGSADGVVYIVLIYLFPNTPNQNIPYINTDILSNAPNNGSWTWNVPSDLFQGRYTLNIGINPFLLADSTAVFTILPSQGGGVSSSPSIASSASSSATSSKSFVSYNGCGLPPLPDYTYTGYQEPCLVTSNGHVQTIFPIVPADLSSSFFGSNALKTISEFGPIATPPSFGSSTTEPDGVVTTSTQVPESSLSPVDFARALQCSTSVTPTPFTITVRGTTTILSSVGCSATSPTSSVENNSNGVCHTSGYTTFSVTGTSSVCCPSGWSTTPLASSQLYCFTQIMSSPTDSQNSMPSTGSASQVIAQAFTRAGVVIGQAATPTGKNDCSSMTPDTWSLRFMVAVLAFASIMS